MSSSAGRSSLSVSPDRWDTPSPSEEQVCVAVATVLVLATERIMVVAAGAPTDERVAVEDAYVEARRVVPADLLDALGEVEAVYHRIGVEYLELVADLRRGVAHDRFEVIEIFESRRPELREIFDRTGLDASCARWSGEATEPQDR